MDCCKDTSIAATNSHLECLKNLHKQGGVKWHFRTVSIAARFGNLEMLKYLHSEGCKFNKNITEIAAQKGHLDCLKYLHSQGYPLNSHTSIFAAINGHLECLKYLHEQGSCEWNSETTYRAACNNNLECLKYAHSQGCEMHPQILYEAVLRGHLEIIYYCLEIDYFIHHPVILYELYKYQKDKSLITNIQLRKIVLHPKLKNNIISEVDRYPKFVKAIEDYEEFINKFPKILESETNLPTDVIKYKIMKYI
jgi:hypothetical protein